MALRASEGLAAVDFLMPGYFVWGKIIEALADVGYETNNLVRPLSAGCDCWVFIGLLTEMMVMVAGAIWCCSLMGLPGQARSSRQ